jgi:putative tricarboxylic transport membrane protein
MEGKGQVSQKVTAGILLAFSLSYFLKGMSLQIGTPRNPGPGFIPVILGVLLVASTGFYLVRVFHPKDLDGEEKKPPEGEKKNYTAILGITGCAVLFPLLLETLKFVVTTFAVSFFMLFLLKPRRWAFSLFLAAGMSVASFLIFSRLLGVALPMGFLEILLFHIGG